MGLAARPGRGVPAVHDFARRRCCQARPSLEPPRFILHGALISMPFLCCGGIELAPPLPHPLEETQDFFRTVPVEVHRDDGTETVSRGPR